MNGCDMLWITTSLSPSQCFFLAIILVHINVEFLNSSDKNYINKYQSEVWSSFKGLLTKANLPLFLNVISGLHLVLNFYLIMLPFMKASLYCRL